ncbi:hypothetical protein IKA15_02105 [bacterium]|nr:hypothetical protein [bacterium]
MGNIFKKILYFFLKKEGFGAPNKAHITSFSTGKTVITAHESMELSSSLDEKVLDAELEIGNLITANFDTPDNLLSYIRTSGTRVHKIGFLNPVLNRLKIQTGYVPIVTGIKAGILNLFLNKRIAFELKDVFLMPNLYEKPITFFYQFYMWYFYKNNLLYTDEKISSLLFEMDNEDKHGKIPTLSYQESDALSKIVKTDINAIKFVMNIRETVNKTKFLKKNSQSTEAEN